MLKRPGGASLMLSGAKARCPAPVPMRTWYKGCDEGFQDVGDEFSVLGCPAG